MTYGDRLIEHCHSTQDGLLLVAPFVKVAVLAQLFDQVDADLPVDVVTRWWPWEIAHGVSDLEVWELFRGRETVRRLFLRQDVHAKYYRADRRCLVGSVNLTQKALGQVDPANFELMVELPSTTPDLVRFEEELWRAAVVVDEDTYLRMGELVAQLPTTTAEPADLPAAVAPRPSPGGGQGVDLATWIPRTRQPEDLYLAYAGRTDELSQASAAASVADLAVLNVPAGLDPETFQRAVRTMLLQTPVVAAIDRFLGVERRFGEVSQHVATLVGGDSSGRDWQVILRWFRHFAADRYHYRRPQYSELVVRSS